MKEMLGEKVSEVPASEYRGGAVTPLQNEIEKLKEKLKKERKKMAGLIDQEYRDDAEKGEKKIAKGQSPAE